MKNPFTWIGLFAVACWSLCGPLNREALEKLPLLPLTALLQVFGLLAVFGWLLFRKRSLVRALRPNRHKWVVAGLYLAYTLLCTVLIDRAADRNTVLVVLLLINLWPVLALTFGIPFFGDQLAPVWFIPGLLLTVVGSYLVISEGALSLAHFWQGLSNQPWIVIGGLVAACIWALCCNLIKKWPEGGEDYTAFNLAVAALALCIPSAPGILRLVADLNLPPVLFILAALKAAGFLFWEIGIRRGHAPTVMTSANFIPLLTALATAWYFNLHTGPLLPVAAVFLSLGALLSRIAARPAPAA
jgi:drug/metabolite transporter (DMT)-like permease